MIEKIIFQLLTTQGPRVVAWALEWLFEDDAGDDIDARLAKFNAAVTNAFDGKGVTPEQRKELNDAIGDFVRGTNKL